MRLRSLTLAIGAAVIVAGAAGAASAATARASDRISVFELPRDHANEVVGLLQAGEDVTIDRCTPSGNWCRVFGERATGWVPASYLIGAAAKVDATPLESLTVPPLDERRDLGHTRNEGFGFFGF